MNSHVRRKHWWLKYFNLQDLRCSWFLLIFALIYTIFWPINEPHFVFPALLALLMCIIALKVVYYDFLSLVTISAVSHMISYPLAAFLALSLQDPRGAIESPLWETTHYAMWTCVVGMSGLAFGAFLVNKLKKRPCQIYSIKKIKWFPSARMNLLLVLMILPIIAIYIYLGFYYHSGVTGLEAYKFEAAATYGFLGYFVYLAYAGVALQIRRYTITHLKSDGIFASVCIFIMLIAFIPSGSRTQALVVLPIALFTFLAWEKRVLMKSIILAVTIAAIIILILGMQFYRQIASGNEAHSLGQRITILGDVDGLFSQAGQNKLEVSKITLTRRLADYVASGYLVSIIPSQYPYRGFENVDKWFVFLLPTLIRPSTDFSFIDGAVTIASYGMRSPSATNNLGSSPIMILGDLYSRFGWLGIFFGMMIIGMIFRLIDFLLRQWRVFEIILYSCMFYDVMNLLNQSLLRHFVFFTRNFLVIVIISFITTQVLYISSKIKFTFKQY